MKKLSPIIVAIAAIFTLVNASVWEGAAATAGAGELPETGLYLATNSFPANTVVDVTNLENGITVRGIVSSGLDTPGLLALLSKDAADAIGLQSRSLGRIRMSQPADPIAFSRFAEGRAYSGDPDYDPAAFVAMNSYDPYFLEEEAGDDLSFYRTEGGDLIVDLPMDMEELPLETATLETATDLSPVYNPPESLPEASSQPVVAEPVAAEPPAAVPVQPPETPPELTLIPAETRPPERGPEPDPAYFIPAIEEATVPDLSSAYEIPSIAPASAYSLDPSLFIDPIGEAPFIIQESQPPVEPLPLVESQPPVESLPPAEPVISVEPVPVEVVYYQAPENQIFTAPLISSLEKGRYYLQIAAYSKAETVQSEISRIDSSLPVAVMNAGSEEKPVYRILIGPVNLGESGALLQRFKGSYKDAFVRLGT